MVLTINEINHLHDIVYDLIKLDLDHNNLARYLRHLPENIRKDIEHWGLNDTVVRDTIYNYLSKNPL
jgi:hypothetical protein